MEGGPAGVTGALQGMAELQQVDLRLLGTASSADANGSAAEVSVAAALAALNTVEPRIVRKLACGKTVAMMLLETGELYMWGDGTFTPTLVMGLKGAVIDIACGTDHYCAITDEGVWNLYTWGSNARGQLGHGDTVARKEPTALRSVVQRVVRVAAGHEFTLFTMDNGAVCGCGRSDQGQLGDCVTEAQLKPRVLSRLACESEVQQPLPPDWEQGDFVAPSGHVQIAARGAQAAMWTSTFPPEPMLTPEDISDLTERQQESEELERLVEGERADLQEHLQRLAFPEFCPPFFAQQDPYIEQLDAMLQRAQEETTKQYQKLEWLREQLAQAHTTQAEEQAELQAARDQLRLALRQAKAVNAQLKATIEAGETDEFRLEQLRAQVADAEAQVEERHTHLNTLARGGARTLERLLGLRERVVFEHHSAAMHDVQSDMLLRLRLRRLQVLRAQLVEEREAFLARVLDKAHKIWSSFVDVAPAAVLQSKRMLAELTRTLSRPVQLRDVVRYSITKLDALMVEGEKVLRGEQAASERVEGKCAIGSRRDGAEAQAVGLDSVVCAQQRLRGMSEMFLLEMSVELDAAGAETGMQFLRGVVYKCEEETGTFELVSETEPLCVHAARKHEDTRMRVTLRFPRAVRLYKPGKSETQVSFFCGVHCSDHGAPVVRLWGNRVERTGTVSCAGDDGDPRAATLAAQPRFGLRQSPATFPIRPSLHAQHAGFHMRLMAIVAENYRLRMKVAIAMLATAAEQTLAGPTAEGHTADAATAGGQVEEMHEWEPPEGLLSRIG